MTRMMRIGIVMSSPLWLLPPLLGSADAAHAMQCDYQRLACVLGGPAGCSWWLGLQSAGWSSSL